MIIIYGIFRTCVLRVRCKDHSIFMRMSSILSNGNNTCSTFNRKWAVFRLHNFRNNFHFKVNAIGIDMLSCKYFKRWHFVSRSTFGFDSAWFGLGMVWFVLKAYFFCVIWPRYELGSSIKWENYAIMYLYCIVRNWIEMKLLLWMRITRW